MKAGKAIYAALTANAGLTALVGTRIYPDYGIQKPTLPYVVYTVLQTNPSPTKDGASKLDTIRVQIDTWSDSFETAQTVSEQVRAVLEFITPGTYGTVAIDGAHLRDEMNINPITASVEMGLFGVSQEYEVRIKR
jgi:hypothetical protein